MDISEVEWKGVVDLIHSAENSGGCGSYVNRVMDAGSFLTNGASSDSLLHGLV